MSLSEYPRLAPVGLLPTITLVPPFVVPGYNDLVRLILRTFAEVRVEVSRPGRAPDGWADLVLFPYDFRLGVRYAAERLQADIDARLAGETAQARRRRVIVVAHSMGGLVARYWLGPLGGARDCRAVITLGTPHRGAPKALDWLVNGVRVGPVRLSKATDVLREWPSVYELLPRYRAVGRDEDQQDPAGALYPHELGSVAAERFADRARAAFTMHEEIRDSWLELSDRRETPEVTAVFARDHATPHRAVVCGARLHVTKKTPGWLPNPDWLGDGTVPAISAIPDELNDDRRAWRAVPDRHLPMASTAAVVEILRTYAGESLAAVRGDTREPPRLGLDLDDLVPAGQEVPVTAKLCGPQQADEATAVWVTVQPTQAAGDQRRYRCSPAGDDRWQALLPPLTPGTHHVAVKAVNVPGVDWVECKDVIGAVQV